MRVQQVHVDRFGKLEDVKMEFEQASNLHCLTGANGSGKTLILRMITLAAGALGAPGARSEYQDYPFSFSVSFDLSAESDSLKQHIHESQYENKRFKELNLSDWSGTATVTVTNEYVSGQLQYSTDLILDGIAESEQLDRHMVREEMSKLPPFKLVFLDANRSYSYMMESRADSSKANLVDSDGGFVNLGSYAGDLLYGEWSQYLIQQDRQHATALRKALRDRDSAASLDPFESLNSTIKKILPHIELIGIHERTGRLEFQTGKITTEFQQLSGGEREVVFILGQLDMMRVNQGILLIDEPELHLHPRLLRLLIRTIQDSSGESQIVVATHSFEVIEQALNANSVFVLSVGEGSVSAERVTSGSAHAQLTLALGEPGLSVAGSTFIAVEGGGTKPQSAHRFRELLSCEPSLHFLNAGEDKRQVENTMKYLSELPRGSRPVRIVGIIDSDFESISGATLITGNLLQLGVHEAENLFLYPHTLNAVAEERRPVKRWTTAEDAIRRYFEKFAGIWIWNRTENAPHRKWQTAWYQGHLRTRRALFRGLKWSEVAEESASFSKAVEGLKPGFRKELDASILEFTEMRRSSDLWKHCLGREVLNEIGKELRYSASSTDLEDRILKGWKRGELPVPPIVEDIRRHLAKLAIHQQ